MALTWNWDKRMGTCTINGRELNLYKGNALCIAIDEKVDPENPDEYMLVWFASDKVHMRNMLGLSRGHDNVMESWGITSMELDTNYKETGEIIQMLAKAKMEITITLYKGEEDG